MICGSLDGYNSRCMHYASGTGITVVSVDYRLAPEHPYPAALDDATFALRWLHAHASDIGLDAKRIGIAGDSAGGCLAAATVIRNQEDRGPAITCQLLVYPMLDYRTVVPDPRYTGRFIGWTFADNATAWAAYLGAATDEVPPTTASPALATQLAGLPPTFIDTGTMDIFHDEDVAFADLLRTAGVDVEFHIWNGATHGFDYLAGRSGLAKRAWKARFDFLHKHLQS
jgi:acetyl esterase/lipase